MVRIKKRRATQISSARFRQLQRAFTQREAIWFVIELIVFVLLAALSVWPMLHAIEAMRLL